MKLSFLCCLTLISSIAFAADLTQPVAISRKDFLEFKTSSYVAGFKKYDSSVLITDNEIRVSLYLNQKQSQNDAKAILKRMKSHLELMLKQYEWAKDIIVNTSVWHENSKATNP